MSGSTFLFYLNSDELCDELLKSISETFFCPLHYTSPPFSLHTFGLYSKQCLSTWLSRPTDLRNVMVLSSVVLAVFIATKLAFV